MVQEIEIKALLTKDKYNYLRTLLPHRYTKINEDNVTTVKFRPKDVRVRFSDKINEVVFKDTDPTKFSRKEISIGLKGIDECNAMIELLKAVGLEEHPRWTTQRADFICEHEGHEYTLSLQHIPNFAYILEAEALCDSDDPEKHIPNLKRMLSSLGCEPLDPDEFRQKIQEYITTFSK